MPVPTRLGCLSCLYPQHTEPVWAFLAQDSQISPFPSLDKWEAGPVLHLWLGARWEGLDAQEKEGMGPAFCPSGDVCPQTGWEKVPDPSLNMLLKPVALAAES